MAQKVHHAKYDGRCIRCGMSFKAGERVTFVNLPKPKSPMHWACYCDRHPEENRDAQPADATEETKGAADFPDDAATEAARVTTPPPVIAPTPDSAAALVAALRALLGDTKPVNADEVRAIVRETLAELAPVRLEIVRPDGTKFMVDGAHYLFPRLVKLLAAGIHVYAWGPAGSGKTTAMLMAAKALDRAGEIDTLDPSTPKSSILGYRTPAGEPVHTAFTRRYGEGGVYVADEADNAPAHVQTLFNSALANGHAPAAWGLIPRHETFSFGGTGNSPGRPTPMFPDRRPMSAAFADRLYFLYWPIDPAIECRAGGLPVPKPPKRKETTCTPDAWVRWVRDIRAWAEKSAPTLMVTPRASLTGLQCLALGETPEEVAHGLVFRGADKALVEKALAAVPLPE
jgi:hypothetical protein